jgi:hypothetical protein
MVSDFFHQGSVASLCDELLWRQAQESERYQSVI